MQTLLNIGSNSTENDETCANNNLKKHHRFPKVVIKKICTTKLFMKLHDITQTKNSCLSKIGGYTLVWQVYEIFIF